MTNLRFRTIATGSIVLLALAVRGEPTFSPAPREASEEDTTIGFVADLQGKWTLEAAGSEALPVRLGQTLEPGTLRATASPAKIVVALFSHQVKTCATANHCSQLVIERPQIPSSSFLGRLRAAANRLFSAPRDTYVSALVRTEKQGLPWRDAVLELSPAGINLNQVFGPEGSRYKRVLVQRKAGVGEAPQWNSTEEFGLHWEKDRPLLVSPHGFKSGLYKLLEVDRKGEPSGREAWVIFADPQTYEEKLRAFHQVKDVAEDWSGELEEGLIQGYLRAFLTVLAEP